MLPGQRLPSLLLSLLFTLTGCHPNYFLLHPLQPVPDISRESEVFDRGQLRVRWLARYPYHREALPAVLVHPDRGSFAKDRKGICLTLAQNGYFAAAANYQRLENLKDKNPLIPWKTPEDIMVALRHLQGHPRVDPGRIAVLGFSRGGIVSLQIASQDPSIRAAVAYYALADFEQWLETEPIYRGNRQSIIYFRQEISKYPSARFFFKNDISFCILMAC